MNRKKVLIIGGVAAVVIVSYLIWRRRQAAAMAGDAEPTDPYGNDIYKGVNDPSLGGATNANLAFAPRYIPYNAYPDYPGYPSPTSPNGTPAVTPATPAVPTPDAPAPTPVAMAPVAILQPDSGKKTAPRGPTPPGQLPFTPTNELPVIKIGTGVPSAPPGTVMHVPPVIAPTMTPTLPAPPVMAPVKIPKAKNTVLKPIGKTRYGKK